MFKRIAPALATIAAPIAVAGAPAPGCTAPDPAACMAGTWRGPFAGADWTFEFKREGDGWSGRHQTSRGKTWRPLLSLAVRGDGATFGIEAQPPLDFDLKRNSADDTLSGEIRIGDRIRLPFAATRDR